MKEWERPPGAKGQAAQNPEARKHISSLGGKSHSREHMSALGKKGGAAVSQDREHMSKIGRKGGRISKRRPANELSKS